MRRASSINVCLECVRTFYAAAMEAQSGNTLPLVAVGARQLQS
jgi:hypothetical protein